MKRHIFCCPGEIDYCLLFPRQRIKFHACKSYGFNIAMAALQRRAANNPSSSLSFSLFFNSHPLNPLPLPGEKKGNTWNLSGCRAKDFANFVKELDKQKVFNVICCNSEYTD